jgi:hypothetical protein
LFFRQQQEVGPGGFLLQRVHDEEAWMEGGYRTHAFDFLNMSARCGKWFAKQRPARRVPEQQEIPRFDQRDVATGEVGAGLKLGTSAQP